MTTIQRVFLGSIHFIPTNMQYERKSIQIRVVITYNEPRAITDQKLMKIEKHAVRLLLLSKSAALLIGRNGHEPERHSPRKKQRNDNTLHECVTINTHKDL